MKRFQALQGKQIQQSGWWWWWEAAPFVVWEQHGTTSTTMTLHQVVFSQLFDEASSVMIFNFIHFLNSLSTCMQHSAKAEWVKTFIESTGRAVVVAGMTQELSWAKDQGMTHTRFLLHMAHTIARGNLDVVSLLRTNTRHPMDVFFCYSKLTSPILFCCDGWWSPAYLGF